ncbi:hypothetical protein JKF63_06501 [Porcisia hertigi]|uniref:RRM domain-containing protein n=1 Tax=Porcisia hertigi TaxID=2761500 RepID=A0A836HXF8_9TRYP|nr:hypothetical protein JKF63_06501 [Porcisia hertigi]
MDTPAAHLHYTPSSTNLFVRYLPREVDDNRLREIFSAFGNITSSMVMRDIHSGQSLGTAFVRYEKHEEALRALYDAQGMPLFGKTVSVQWAKQQHDSTPAGQDRLRMNKLFLRNVPLEVTKEELVDLVKSCGSVIKVTMHGDTTPVTDPAFCRRIVFITFAEPGAAEAALRAVHNTCAFHQCRGVPLMGKLSEDYTQKMRTPPDRNGHLVVQYPRKESLSATETLCTEVPAALCLGRRTSKTDAAENTCIGAQRPAEMPRGADSVSTGHTSQNPRTRELPQMRTMSRTTHFDAPGYDAEAVLWRSCEAVTVPKTIYAPDSGITVTVRHRPHGRTPKKNP